jgi:hypothetical protein
LASLPYYLLASPPYTCRYITTPSLSLPHLVAALVAGGGVATQAVGAHGGIEALGGGEAEDRVDPLRAVPAERRSICGQV